MRAARDDRIEDPRSRFCGEPVSGQREAGDQDCGNHDPLDYNAGRNSQKKRFQHIRGG
jgi:hypothetical protein